MGRQDPFNDSEAQTGTGPSGAVALPETVEEVPAHLGLDAGASILHGHENTSLDAISGNRDLPPSGVNFRAFTMRFDIT